MENNNVVFLGTELKLKVDIEPIETDTEPLTMDNYDFTIEVYCTKKGIITASKKGNPNDTENFEVINMVRTAVSGSYLVLVDTNIIGTGTIKCKITAKIKDDDFKDDDGYRTEVVILDTGIEVIKNL